MDWAMVIQNYGVPVVAMFAMAWYVYDRGEKERLDRKEAQTQHKNEVDNLSEVINNNTLAITRLVDHITERE